MQTMNLALALVLACILTSRRLYVGAAMPLDDIDFLMILIFEQFRFLDDFDFWMILIFGRF